MCFHVQHNLDRMKKKLMKRIITSIKVFKFENKICIKRNELCSGAGSVERVRWLNRSFLQDSMDSRDQGDFLKQYQTFFSSSRD